jgi:hypothetical protein
VVTVFQLATGPARTVTRHSPGWRRRSTQPL